MPLQTKVKPIPVATTNAREDEILGKKSDFLKARLKPLIGPVTVSTVLFLSTFGGWKEEITPYIKDIQGDQEAGLNDALGALLGILGMVYALSFAHFLTVAYDRQHAIRTGLSSELACLEKVVLLVGSMSGGEFKDDDIVVEKIEIWTRLLDYVDQTGDLLSPTGDHNNVGAHFQILDKLYAVVPIVGNIASDDFKDEVDRVLLQGTLEALSDCTDHRYQWVTALKSGFPKELWSFITLTSGMMFFAVVFLQTASLALDILMCLFVVASIASTVYLLADLNQPFHGSFRVDLEWLWAFRALLNSRLSRRKSKLGQPAMDRLRAIGIECVDGTCHEIAE
eukprot:GFYU01007899.1.p1 GENE.GFYU01007899.1~~GFYU01007899.1.p1  ORF type:complete len:338 (-),score=88.99 GFYU01007899.1:138-1151(-)